MTWTLRFYDEDGVEICWVTADPWDYEITHPDGESSWDFIPGVLAGMSDGRESAHVHDTAPDGSDIYTTAFYFHGSDPKEHLEWVEDEMVGGRIDSSQLKDE